ncbi:hypothetical protein LTR05_002601 [Lithohypha guttulata]|uniref:Uncharacterized protein n=1 Tax=Lithohypha guttulata TaxID=1690604 RepID=A0AAN7T4K9_9EURO|nr:hypothetical protein LTR05_002601 [Lithohypha guttulata]
MSRRLYKSTLRKALLVILATWCFIDIVRFHFLRFSVPPVPNTTEVHTPRIFIASTHWNNEGILRNHWNKAVLQLVENLGPNNTFVSVYESGSWDNSKDALRKLEQELDHRGVGKKIVLDETTHEDEIAKPPGETGWINTPRGKQELRRIPYLSRLRNLSLAPLEELAEQDIFFDKILFLNDVVFSLSDVLTLLNTNNGQYAAACSLDFSRPPHYYDTFALRDSEGHEAVMSTWPYFRSSLSRTALKQGNAVPVTSCWNGYNKAAYDAMNGSAGELSLFRYLFRCWENRLRRWFTTDWFKIRVVRNRVKKWQGLSSSNSEVGVRCLINEMQVLAGNGWAHV